MIKDKYKFKLTTLEVQNINFAVDNLYANHGQTTDLEVQLPLVCLKEFKMRLAGQLVFPKRETPIYFKAPEALAYLLLFKGNLITDNITTRLIAHQIDRTI